MTPPFFSVCIPTYNRAHMLPAAIDSALAQDFTDYELVIIDNASTDNTQDVLKRYSDPRIKVFRNEKTVSMYANHNKCVEHASGDWIVFLHSDDVFKDCALQKLQKLCVSSDGLAAITPTSNYYTAFWLARSKSSHFLLDDTADKSLFFRHMGTHIAGACINKSVFDELNGFSSSTVIADYDFYLRCQSKWLPLLITKDSPVNIGTSERSTNKLIADKKWLFEQAPIVARFAAVEPFYSAIFDSIASWEPFEVARFLMYLVAADARGLLRDVESLDAPVIRQARCEKSYRHVWLYKLLGFQCYKGIMPLAALARKVMP